MVKILDIARGAEYADTAVLVDTNYKYSYVFLAILGGILNFEMLCYVIDVWVCACVKI